MKNSKPINSDFQLVLPKKDEDVIEADGFAEAVALSLAAMARNDNLITVQEYESLAYAADYLAEMSEHPALFRVLVLHGLYTTSSFDKTIRKVKRTSQSQSEKARLAQQVILLFSRILLQPFLAV